ncbi:MAG TPA: non-canonical purine NTP pyrophosphatase [Burkholderiales bacterium]|nr:non-canonical purine NTP pyrophosphatase [Burkholderiales bacterium]
MIHTKLRFVSKNEFKRNEAASILVSSGVDVVALNITVEELQTEDTTRLVKDKTLKAFAKVGRPLFVEHTGLYLAYLNGLPGGLTQIFWDRLGADRFACLFGQSSDCAVVARTVIGYTDARRFFSFVGEIAGRITPEPRGPRDFQWDCVFQPYGFDKTFAELGAKKNEISMRRIALDQFANFLRQHC